MFPIGANILVKRDFYMCLSTMVITNPKGQVQQGRDQVRKELSLNNSATAKLSDDLVSVLEAGEGSMYLRDQIDHVLHNLAQ